MAEKACQILAVKDQLVTHAFDDIVGIFTDTWTFDNNEKLIFNIYQIKGYTRDELIQYLYGRRVQRARIYRSKTSKWTTERPEKKIGWKHTDGKWYFHEREGLEWTMKDLTQTDKDKLASDITPVLERLQTLGKIKPNISEYPENFTEVPQIVVAVIS